MPWALWWPALVSFPGSAICVVVFHPGSCCGRGGQCRLAICGNSLTFHITCLTLRKLWIWVTEFCVCLLCKVTGRRRYPAASHIPFQTCRGPVRVHIQPLVVETTTECRVYLGLDSPFLKPDWTSLLFLIVLKSNWIGAEWLHKPVNYLYQFPRNRRILSQCAPYLSIECNFSFHFFRLNNSRCICLGTRLLKAVWCFINQVGPTVCGCVRHIR